MKMREGHGWGTRIIIYAIVVAFALFGLGTIPTLFSPTQSVASVNGEDITVGEMEVAVERNRRLLLGQGATPEDIDEDSLRADVLQSLITRRLLVQGVTSLNMTTSDVEIDAELKATKTFQLDGTFDENQYRLVLASVGYNPATYKAELRRDKTISQLARTIEASAIVTELEAKRASSLSRQTRDVAVLTFDPVDLEDQISVTGPEVEAYYQDNQSEFFSEESVDLAYVAVDRAAMAAALEVSEDDLRSAYEEQKDRYMTPENRRIAHILVSTDDRTIEEARVIVESIQSQLDSLSPIEKMRSADSHSD